SLARWEACMGHTNQSQWVTGAWVTADRSSSYLRVNHRAWMPAYDVHSQHLFMSGFGGGSADPWSKSSPCTNHVFWGVKPDGRRVARHPLTAPRQFDILQFGPGWDETECNSPT